MGKPRMNRCSTVLLTLTLLPIVALGIAPQNAQAQGGTITGQVTDADTGAPVELAQVTVEGTRISVTTTSQGRYLVSGVSAGTRTVTVQRIGYSEASQEVTVAEGAAVNLDFALTSAPVSLSGIVVTATGEQQKLSIANVIGTIGADSIVATAPITNVTDLLQGRVAGVMTFSNAGMTGSAARIRIRGFNSLSQDNSPLMIIDGVRVENTSGGGSRIGPRQYSSGWTAGAITDLNPEEIESIDVVKGPSAATLYGTDAANGVIIIRTKRGRPGDTRWTVYTEGGIIEQASDVHTGYFAWGRDADGASIRCENRVRVAGGCTLDSLTSWSPFRDSPAAPLGMGHREQLGVQVSGGVERFRYFLSTELENETGYLELSESEIARKQAERGGVEIPDWQRRPNYLKRLAMRGNITARLNESADINVSTGVTLQQSQIPSNGVFWRGSWGPGYNDDSEGWWLGDRPGDLFAVRAGSNITRFTTGINGNWIPSRWLTLRGTVGLDHSAQFSDNLLRRGEDTSGSFNPGFRNHIRSDIALYTVDLGTTTEFDLTPSIKSRTSTGVQYNRRQQGVAQAYGSDLPPGAQTVNGAANYRASESNVESVVAGTYVEQTFDIDGRLFLTAAVRADGASNFGKDFNTAWYPKGGLSWLISEEGFFPRGSFINSLRYRFAYGASGIQPAATDALAAINFGSVFANGASRTGATLNALGNPDLGPERVTEYETGLDMELFDSRVQVEATAYYRKSVDALVRRAMPRSVGITGSGQLDNVGSVRNMGIEADVQADVFSVGGVNFSLNVNGSVNSNVLLELAEGLRPPEDRFIKFVEGYPLYGQWDRPVLGWSDTNGDGVLQADEVQVGDSIIFIGNTNPTRMLNFTPMISLFNGTLHLSSLFVYRGGWVQTNFSELNKCNFGSCWARNDPEASLHSQAQYIAFTKPGLTYAGYQEDGTFTRWAEASVSYSVQPGLLQKVGLGATGATVSLSARNLMLWSDYTGPDPEVTANPSLGGNFGTRWDLGYDNPTAPPARYIILRVALNF